MDTTAQILLQLEQETNSLGRSPCGVWEGGRMPGPWALTAPQPPAEGGQGLGGEHGQTAAGSSTAPEDTAPSQHLHGHLPPQSHTAQGEARRPVREATRKLPTACRSPGAAPGHRSAPGATPARTGRRAQPAALPSLTPPAYQNDFGLV